MMNPTAPEFQSQSANNTIVDLSRDDSAINIVTQFNCLSSLSSNKVAKASLNLTSFWDRSSWRRQSATSLKSGFDILFPCTEESQQILVVFI